MVDESYRRDESEGFLSCYDETKYRSHEVAEDRIGRGYPIVMVQPGGVYGPDDHSEVGNMIEQASTGKLMAKAFPDMGIMLVHVEDVADGVLLAYDKGEIGESYVLSGEKTTMGEIVDKAAAAGRPQAAADDDAHADDQGLGPAGAAGRPGAGLPAQPGRAGQVSDGVTYWASDEKARRELGFQPRDMDTRAAPDARSRRGVGARRAAPRRASRSSRAAPSRAGR